MKNAGMITLSSPSLTINYEIVHVADGIDIITIKFSRK